MIFPRTSMFFIVLALATAAAATPPVPPSKLKAEMRSQSAKRVQEVAIRAKAAAAAANLKASGNSDAPGKSALRMQAAASDEFLPAMQYNFLSAGCADAAFLAMYYPTSCVAYDGYSSRYNCAPDKGEVQYLLYMNEKCSGKPYQVTPLFTFAEEGECQGNLIYQCSAELTYGLEESFVTGLYDAAACAPKSLTSAMFEEYGCDGRGFSDVCEGDVLKRTVHYLTDTNCTGEPVFPPEYLDVGACTVSDSNPEQYESIFCSADEFFEQHPLPNPDGGDDDDDSAPQAVSSWVAIFATSIVACALLLHA